MLFSLIPVESKNLRWPGSLMPHNDEFGKKIDHQAGYCIVSLPVKRLHLTLKGLRI